MHTYIDKLIPNTALPIVQKLFGCIFLTLFLFIHLRTDLKLKIHRKIPTFIFPISQNMRNDLSFLSIRKFKISQIYIEKFVKNLINLQKFSFKIKNLKNSLIYFKKKKSYVTNKNNYSLPVTKFINSIMKLINYYNTILILSDTGTGKTTQIPKIILKNLKHPKKLIICSQPRRLAAIISASRVNSEFGYILGEKIGYKIRFESCLSKKTQLTFLTDGMLLKEIIQSFNFKKISFMILDEIHERNINLDLILGIIKGIQTKKTVLKLLIMSATIDYAKIENFFPFSLKLTIPGKTFPVNIKWLKIENTNYYFSLFKLVAFLLVQKKLGDILIFLTGQDEIECVLKILLNLKQKLQLNHILFIPLFSKITQIHNRTIYSTLSIQARKCILSTNICETSITLNNTRFVVDNGLNKIKFFHPNFLFDKIQISYVSKSSVHQRSGRAGRTSLGTCFRLYTKSVYDSFMFNSNFPEIKRTNLSNLILFIKSTYNMNLNEFDFLDIPPTKNFQSALYNLWILSMINNLGNLSHDGKIISRFNLEPTLSKMLINSTRFKCSYEILIIISLISNNIIGYKNLFVNPSKINVNHEYKYFSEFLIILDMYKKWELNLFDSNWCKKNNLNLKLLSKIRKTKKNIKNQFYFNKLRIKSCKKHWSRILKTLVSSYFLNASYFIYNNCFIHCFTELQIKLHPNSTINRTSVAFKYIIFSGLIISKVIVIYFISKINILWLLKYGNKIFKFIDDN